MIASPEAEVANRAAIAAQMDGDFAQVQVLGSQLVALSKRTGDKLAGAHGYRLLGNVCLHNGDGDSAERYYQMSLQFYGLAGDEFGAGTVLLNMGTLAIDIRLDPKEAAHLYEQCLAIFRRYNEPAAVALTLANLGEVSRLGGDYAQALTYGTESLKTFLQLHQAPRAARQCINIAHYHLLRREYHEMLEMLQQARAHLSVQHNPGFLAIYFEMWFLVATELKRFEDAARIVGYVDLFRVEHASPRHAGMMPWFSRETERLHRAMEPDAMRGYFREGEDMSLEDAHALTETIAAFLR